jgi:hypothetical protein
MRSNCTEPSRQLVFPGLGSGTLLSLRIIVGSSVNTLVWLFLRLNMQASALTVGQHAWSY